MTLHIFSITKNVPLLPRDIDLTLKVSITSEREAWLPPLHQTPVHPWPARFVGRPVGQPAEPELLWPRASRAARTLRLEAVGSGRWPLVTCYGFARPRKKVFFLCDFNLCK